MNYDAIKALDMFSRLKARYVPQGGSSSEA